MRPTAILLLTALLLPAGAHAEPPKSQADFVTAFTSAQPRYQAADNELKKSAVKAELERTYKAAAPGNQAVNWEGKLTRMGTNGDGHAYVVVEIAKDVTIKTWNNSFSDSGDLTLIRNGSPLFNTVADMKTGQRVRFTAQLIRLSNMTERGAVFEPDMVARFTKIEAIQ